MLDLTDFPTLRNLLKKYGVWAKKKLGQNFLIDRGVLEKIITTAKIEEKELVVEIGPGPGVLTQALLNAKARVEAIELDSSILPVLKEATRRYKSFLTIYEQHILDFTPPDESYKLVANIPYHLTSPILRRFLLEVENRPTKIVLLVQKEVAQKLCAGTDRESALSMLVKIYGTPQIVDIVPAKSFFPAPKVDSAILLINVAAKPRIQIPLTLMQKMLFAGFAEPRKKLKNVLPKKCNTSASEIENIFSECNISPDIRAQNLNFEQWECLAQKLYPDWEKDLPS